MIIKPHRLLVISLALALALGSSLLKPFDAPVAAADGATFVDPTASLGTRANINLGQQVYIGPFANLHSGSMDPRRAVTVGNESNVQDNATLEAEIAAVTLGEQVIIAHGATVRGARILVPQITVGTSKVFAAQIGVTGSCPNGAAKCPSFVSFNALVDGGIVQKDAMVGALARVGPGVIIPSGYKVLPGKNIATPIQANPSNGKIVPVTEADREFMRGVVEVNTCFASSYTQLATEDSNNVLGINYDPGHCDFNSTRQLPTLGSTHTPTRDTSFRNRIIGDVRMSNTLSDLNAIMGVHISLRADEGEPFEVGTISSMADGVVFHALEHTHIHLGNDANYGVRSIIHGGPTSFAGFIDTTVTGEHFTIGAQSVFFRSRAGDNCKVGFKSLVQESDLPAGTTIGDRKVIIGGVEVGVVEW